MSSTTKGERTAAQAWDYLSSAMAAVGESAKEAGKQTADLADQAAKTGRRVSRRRKRAKLAKRGTQLVGNATGKADEAWVRANAAAAALAGRKPRRPWGLIAGIALLGVAVGWAAASSARAALERQAEEEELELADTAVVITPAREV